MSERFSLGPDDKFTMLSGIAHDPIQRDIFTPLFLGAQLLVPSREDIQHEKLAEWMRIHGPTVTHLTPAMGQILVGGASAEFPSLHHAFFVGDILIKRDCRRLQELAHNCNIVNMYGTTETQRAVSYYEIPSQNKDLRYLDGMGDVIPAGKGMLDVQVLVVDRENHNRLCNIGESGEIYIRAGGLAEGYLGSDDVTVQLNKTKFVQNWFVDPQKWIEEDSKRVQSQEKEEPWRAFYLGPRDRLYRSGDLGHYMSDGNVACTGRADNQIKIRGFRIELGEIDTHLSQHPLVRENITLVRRDKDEEPTLVSYIVPDLKKWEDSLQQQGLSDKSQDSSMVGMLKRFQRLRDDAREHLKRKLPAYAVPTVFVPLERMPLNPNGKIDKPALPFPEKAELFAASARRPSRDVGNLTPTETTIAQIWSEVIRSVPADAMRPTDSFFDLGGHSIMAQGMLVKVRAKWQGTDVSMSTIFRNPTLRGFALEVDRAADPTGLLLSPQDELDGIHQEKTYYDDAEELLQQLPDGITQTPKITNGDKSRSSTIFITGATGFLGSYILRDVLRSSSVRVIAHVRATSPESGFERIVQTCKAYGIWSEDWRSSLEVVTGDLGQPKLGLSPDVWQRLAREITHVVHNGARVHWVLPYSSLRASNTLSTLALIELCMTETPKSLVFVSSTAVLDSEHYVQLSNRGNLVSEADDLEGSRKDLGTGYGQSKWVSERLVREAGKRGLQGAVVRPGYVTGDPVSGSK